MYRRFGTVYRSHLQGSSSQRRNLWDIFHGRCSLVELDPSLPWWWRQQDSLLSFGTLLPKYTASRSEVVIFMVTSLDVSNQIRQDNSGFHKMRGICRRAERLPGYAAGARLLRLRRFSPISIIPPLLPRASFASYRRCINLSWQHR
jgi:hypothetical protein